MILVDSDVIIDLLRGRAHVVDAFRHLVAMGRVLCDTAVVRAEIGTGVRSGEEARMDTLFKLLTCLDIGPREGRCAGDLLRKLRASHGLELGDALMAATALVQGIPLWTLNVRHYRATGVTLLKI